VPGIHDFEHYRLPVLVEPPWSKGINDCSESYCHVAALVGLDGKVYIGVARPNWMDGYSRKLGLAIAAGRALENLIEIKADFQITGELPVGIKLRDYCRGLALEYCKSNLIPLVDIMEPELGDRD
jgi:hypothetical protein